MTSETQKTKRGHRPPNKIYKGKSGGQFFSYELDAYSKHQIRYLGHNLQTAITTVANHLGITEDDVIFPDENDDERRKRNFAEIQAELAKPKRSIESISREIELALHRQSELAESLQELYRERQGISVGESPNIYCCACGECIVALPRKLCFRCNSKQHR